MKSYGVTIQMKPLQQCFRMVLFTKYVVLTLSLWVKSYSVAIQMKTSSLCSPFFLKISEYQTLRPLTAVQWHSTNLRQNRYFIPPH